MPFPEVDARHTSQRCPRRGHTERANRDHFHCRRCGLAGPAAVVAGINVRDRARSAWVLVFDDRSGGDQASGAVSPAPAPGRSGRL
ncbi:zinc ribbon domain-containing protein [Streptomyces sp. NPDC096048]|uniref:zinc ribbon domain-containing protein n=1 Tax=Streptomyces sp. NPDC096048 TaxID=3366072 RepID=UPI003828D764